jgi:hypothetical protein
MRKTGYRVVRRPISRSVIEAIEKALPWIRPYAAGIALRISGMAT